VDDQKPVSEWWNQTYMYTEMICFHPCYYILLAQMKINQTGDRKLECNVNQDIKNNKKKKQTQKHILKKIPYSFLNFDTTHKKEKHPITFMIKPGWKHQKKLNNDEKN